MKTYDVGGASATVVDVVEAVEVDATADATVDSVVAAVVSVEAVSVSVAVVSGGRVVPVTVVCVVFSVVTSKDGVVVSVAGGAADGRVETLPSSVSSEEQAQRSISAHSTARMKSAAESCLFDRDDFMRVFLFTVSVRNVILS